MIRRAVLFPGCAVLFCRHVFFCLGLFLCVIFIIVVVVVVVVAVGLLNNCLDFFMERENFPIIADGGEDNDNGILSNQHETSGSRSGSISDRVPPIDINVDQGEGVPGIYIRMPDGSILDDALVAENKEKKQYKLGDDCFCGAGKMVERQRYSHGQLIYKFLGCSDFKGGTGCSHTESLSAPSIPKYFYRAPVHTPVGMTLFYFIFFCLNIVNFISVCN